MTPGVYPKLDPSCNGFLSRSNEGMNQNSTCGNGVEKRRHKRHGCDEDKQLQEGGCILWNRWSRQLKLVQNLSSCTLFRFHQIYVSQFWEASQQVEEAWVVGMNTAAQWWPSRNGAKELVEPPSKELDLFSKEQNKGTCIKCHSKF